MKQLLNVHLVPKRGHIDPNFSFAFKHVIMIPNSKRMIEIYLKDFKDLFSNVRIQKKKYSVEEKTIFLKAFHINTCSRNGVKLTPIFLLLLNTLL